MPPGAWAIPCPSSTPSRGEPGGPPLTALSLGPGDPRYPVSLSALTGRGQAPDLTCIGRLDILAKRKLALFCSRQCPGSLIIKAQDLAHELRRSGVTVAGGFQSPVEKECLTVLLRGPAPVILCPARSIDKIAIRPEWRTSLHQGRLLLLSAFPANLRRPTAQLAAQRNRLVAALADLVLIVHAAASSKTFDLCRELCPGGKLVYTFDDPANADLLSLGAAPLMAADIPGVLTGPG